MRTGSRRTSCRSRSSTPVTLGSSTRKESSSSPQVTSGGRKRTSPRQRSVGLGPRVLSVGQARSRSGGAHEDVSRIVARAPASARVLPEQLPFAAPEGLEVAVRVAAAITHTIGGIRVDETTRVLRDDGSAIPGLFAAGVDVGGVATGGYASGLAQALVLGLVAAESAVASS
jgi:succinate dehydrogenase/fumarate reductase flavoprotein subunit